MSSNDNSELAIIFCTKNSAGTIENSITKVKQSRYNPDIIVVDGFSTDNTVKIAKKIEGTTIIEQPIKKFPGKGIAMRAGLEEVLKNQNIQIKVIMQIIIIPIKNTKLLFFLMQI